MEALEEITEWNEGSAANHVYLLDGSSMLAYVRRGTSTPFWFSKPITISRTGRKFRKLAENPFDVGSVAKDPDVIEVLGSKGTVYTVNTVLKTCTCPGYSFRGVCKHTA